ncbi:MAG: hypothetical protein ACE5GY_08575 [Thermodesulfobacteriota bacterium]
MLNRKKTQYPPHIQEYVDKLVRVLTHGTPNNIGYLKGVVMAMPHRAAANSPAPAPAPRPARKAPARLKLVYSKEG